MTETKAIVLERPIEVQGSVPPDALESVAEYLGLGQKRATVTTYGNVWRAFARYAEAQGQSALPCTEGVLLGYLATLAKKGSPVSSIRRVVTVVRKAHVAAGVPDPTQSRAVKQLLAGVAAKHGKKPKRQAAPFVLRDLQAAYPLLSTQGIRGVRDWAMLSTAWWGALRRSEVVSLNIGDIERPPGGVVLRLRDTKTGDEETVGYPLQDSPLCPVAALDDWLGLIGQRPATSPLFYTIRNGDRIIYEQRASAQALNRLVKRLARDLELPGGPWSAHSLRAGAATAMRGAGVPEELAMRQTRHKSREVFAEYVRGGGYWEDHPMYKML